MTMPYGLVSVNNKYSETSLNALTVLGLGINWVVLNCRTLQKEERRCLEKPTEKRSINYTRSNFETGYH